VIVVWNRQFLAVPHGAASLVARDFTPGAGWGAPDVRAGGWGVAVSNLAVTPSGEAVLLWASFVAVNLGVKADRFRPSVGWQNEPLEPLRVAIGPVGLDDQGNGWTVYPGLSADSNRPPDRLIAQRRDVASGWQTPQTVSHPGVTVGQGETLAVSPSGTAVVLWTEKHGTRQALLASTSTGLAWEPPQSLVEREARACGANPATTGVYGPQVGVDGTGNAVAAWIEWDCSNATVWSSRLTGPDV
jgi:hypothetical protein